MLEEVIDLTVGLGVALLPLLVLSVPAIVLFVVLPAILLLALAAPQALIGAVIAVPPYLVARRLRRRRRRTANPRPAMPRDAANATTTGALRRRSAGRYPT
jgi:Flp pilus assembly protein TadB